MGLTVEALTSPSITSFVTAAGGTVSFLLLGGFDCCSFGGMEAAPPNTGNRALRSGLTEMGISRDTGFSCSSCKTTYPSQPGRPLRIRWSC